MNVPDLIRPGLRILFVGINPGLTSGATGHHFARPGNRFWPTLHRAGLTARQLRPHEGDELLALGIGITNFSDRVTRTAAELSRAELRAGARRLERLVAEHQPDVVAVVGITAYRDAFDRPKAAVGPQDEPIGGRPVVVLPNPSGLNAHYTPADLARVYRELLAQQPGRP